MGWFGVDLGEAEGLTSRLLLGGFRVDFEWVWGGLELIWALRSPKVSSELPSLEVPSLEAAQDTRNCPACKWTACKAPPHLRRLDFRVALRKVSHVSVLTWSTARGLVWALSNKPEKSSDIMRGSAEN